MVLSNGSPRKRTQTYYDTRTLNVVLNSKSESFKAFRSGVAEMALWVKLLENPSSILGTHLEKLGGDFNPRVGTEVGGSRPASLAYLLSSRPLSGFDSRKN